MRKKLLIIEDNEDAATIIAEAFKMSGFEVTAAADGESGLKALQAEVPEVIILDLFLPRVDGLGVLASIVSDERMADTYVIVISGATPLLSQVVGADMVLAKPISFGYLRTLAERLAGGEKWPQHS